MQGDVPQLLCIQPADFGTLIEYLGMDLVGTCSFEYVAQSTFIQVASALQCYRVMKEAPWQESSSSHSPIWNKQRHPMVTVSTYKNQRC